MSNTQQPPTPRGHLARLARTFYSWRAQWKNRHIFRAFDKAVDHAIDTDARLLELKQARKQRIHEIIFEIGRNEHLTTHERHLRPPNRNQKRGVDSQ